MSKDFDGPPLAAGAVAGVRAFKVDTFGRLTGVTVRHVFRPGENVASCRRFDDAPLWGENDLHGKPKHRAGTAGCTCGYWAHYDGTNTYRGQGQITGIIEGYGLVTLGESGFRAEKARLAALVSPASEEVDPMVRRCLDVYEAAGVPVYRSLRAALRDHPVTHPRREPEPVVVDADFWTRPAREDVVDDIVWGMLNGPSVTRAWLTSPVNVPASMRGHIPVSNLMKCSCALCRGTS